MNKVTGDLIRTVLKVGGAVLATSGFLPAQCSITDPQLAQYAGIATLILGTFLGVRSAQGAQNLHDAVDATPQLPPAHVVEKEGSDVIP